MWPVHSSALFVFFAFLSMNSPLRVTLVGLALMPWHMLRTLVSDCEFHFEDVYQAGKLASWTSCMVRGGRIVLADWCLFLPSEITIKLTTHFCHAMHFFLMATKIFYTSLTLFTNPRDPRGALGIGGWWNTIICRGRRNFFAVLFIDTINWKKWG